MENMIDKQYLTSKLAELKKKNNLENIVIEIKYPPMGDYVARIDYKDYNKNRYEFSLEIFPAFENENYQDTILRHEFVHIKDMINWFSNSMPDYEYFKTKDLKGSLVRLIWDISVDVRTKNFPGILGKKYRVKEFREKIITNKGVKYRINDKFDLDKESEKIEVLIKNNKLTFCAIKEMVEKKFDYRQTYLRRDE